MSEFCVRKLEPPYDKQWDSFVERSNNGTLFHRLDFLGYHQKRFQAQEHPVVILKGTTLHGVLPAALFEEQGKKIVRSPYGGSFGGPVFMNPPTYDESKNIIEALLKYWRGENVHQIVLSPAPELYERIFCETFSFGLLEHGFQLINQDITHCVDLRSTGNLDAVLTSRARNMVNKAKKQNFNLEKHGSINDFYSVLEKTYAKLNRRPTHSLEEFKALNALFPDRIFADLLYLDKKPLAGIGFIVSNSRVALAFYLATDPEYQQKQAQSLLIYESLYQFKQDGFRFVDFGTSSQSMQGNPNLFLFKESFGSLGRFRKTYALMQ